MELDASDYHGLLSFTLNLALISSKIVPFLNTFYLGVKKTQLCALNSYTFILNQQIAVKIIIKDPCTI